MKLLQAYRSTMFGWKERAKILKFYTCNAFRLGDWIQRSCRSERDNFPKKCGANVVDHSCYSI